MLYFIIRYIYFIPKYNIEEHLDFKGNVIYLNK